MNIQPNDNSKNGGVGKKKQITFLKANKNNNLNISKY